MPRPKKTEPNVQITVAASPEVEKVIEELAIRFDYSKAKLAGKLLIRGLIAYERDGFLDEPQIRDESNQVEIPVIASEGFNIADSERRNKKAG